MCWRWSARIRIAARSMACRFGSSKAIWRSRKRCRRRWPRPISSSTRPRMWAIGARRKNIVRSTSSRSSTCCTPSSGTAGCERWIQISSLGVYPARHHYGTDETVPPELSGLDGYTQTKAEAEVVVQRHVREHGLPAVILRPGFIYGPGDRHALTRIVEKIEAGKMKFLGRGDRVLNNTAVENLCDAILLAIEKPDIVGETFNIRDERLVTREEFVHTIADYLGKPHPRHVPEWLGRALVGPIEAIGPAPRPQDAAAS